MRRHDGEPRRGGLVRSGVRMLAGGVGLVSESIKASSSKTPKEEKTREEATQATGTISNPDIKTDAKTEFPSNQIGASAPPPSYSETQGTEVSDIKGKGVDTQTPPNEKDQQFVIEPESLQEEWDLDDAQDEIIRPSSDQLPATTDPSDLETQFLTKHPLPTNTNVDTSSSIPQTPPTRLSLPVVLPQRRPKDRSRGFIRAYAPILENVGITQETWIGFLDTFQKSSAANPWLNAINMASIGTMFMPHVIGFAVGFAIQQATNVAIELQARGRTNTFLQKANQEFFQPRGLYCLVMTWNPDSTKKFEQVNLISTISSRSNPSTGLTNLPDKYRSSDGKTYGEWEFPEVAPLIFPTLDQLAKDESMEGGKEKSRLGNGVKFVGEYWDKRATAAYVMKNPTSALSQVPISTFTSRYADPNSRAASGSLISFVTGGHLVPNPESRGLIGGILNVTGQAIRGEKQGSGWDVRKEREKREREWNEISKEEKLEIYGRYSRDYRGLGGGKGGYIKGIGGRDVRLGVVSTPVGLAKKVLKQNVLYLMIVNMPSEEEIEAARTAVPY